MSNSGDAPAGFTLTERQGSPPKGRRVDAESRGRARALDPHLLVIHSTLLHRVARAWCRSPHEAEDLVQETFARVLTRPRTLHAGNEMRYLLRALRNTHIADRRAARRRPSTVPMLEMDSVVVVDAPAAFARRDLMAAIAAVPQPYRDAVVAIDLLGLSYEQAARRLATSKRTINSRLFPGREHVARVLDGGPGD